MSEIRYNDWLKSKPIEERRAEKHICPLDRIQWIPLEKVQANDYNPNSVATNEMRLLYTSIKEDGYTQPVVTFHDPEIDKYIIVDGFHRHLTMKLNKDIYELYQGLLPCVVIEKDINQRMASTVRHNRARGKHAVTGMSNMVMQMLMNGMSDEEICNKIGLEADELVRLKHLTGFSKLFKDVEYKKSWKHELMLKNEQKYNAELKGNNPENIGDKTVLEKSENPQ